ncbi:unnamed protein product [Trifolium pratense]|uniref:Uncharacterized protein n=1 Tax=Trifolium pratense TaxID=57577 RepID=A0ACB0ITM9_TRIPR|nr:unnamed protein product [Trifolium pratense]
MESYSISYSSSNYKSSYIPKSTKKTNGSMKHDEYPFQSKNYSWLHSVRKSPAKSWNKKAPIAPMAPIPPKVYRVDPINFKELVQSLTCAPDFLPPQSHQQLLQSTNQNHNNFPSLPVKNLSNRVDTVEVSTPQPPLVPVNITNSWYHYFQNEYFGKNSDQVEEVMTPDLLEMNLFSPTSFDNWCYVPSIMTPRA